MHAKAIALLLGLAASAGARSPTAGTVCVAHSSVQRAQLLELYTSQGCSSCPPAERWLAGMADGPQPIPLAFHVDYWDGPQWRDRYADSRYSARQHAVAARAGETLVYTPEVVLDGREQRFWYRGLQQPAAARAAVSMLVRARSGAPWRISIDSRFADAADATRDRSYVVVAQDGIVTRIGGGENRGATLRQDHVVRAYSGPWPSAHAEVRLAMPADLDVGQATLVVFLQNPINGDVAQAMELPLRTCVPPG